MLRVDSWNNKPIKGWVSDIEEWALKQAYNIANLPFVHKRVALMPDCHQWFWFPIWWILATKWVIIPNAAGVDLWCWMCAVKTSLTHIDKDVLKTIMWKIREAIPVGFEHHKDKQNHLLMPGMPIKDNDIVAREFQSALRSLWTLGWGNHFIEIQKWGDWHIWIMIHSGSRNLGKQVADHYNKLAVELNKKYFSEVPKERELAFLPIDSEEWENYIREMTYCVEYALANRKLMMDRICEIFTQVIPTHPSIDNWETCTDDLIGTTFEPMINIAHNYIRLENHFGENVMVHRKWATSAREWEIGIIPGSQWTCSYIVEWLGNKDSFMSCSHWAGRKMSRTEAEKTLNLEDEIALMDKQGIVHWIRNKSDLDEAPSAYKNIDEVMENQKDLVKIVTRLTPLAVIKG